MATARSIWHKVPGILVCEVHNSVYTETTIILIVVEINVGPPVSMSESVRKACNQCKGIPRGL